MEAGKNINGCFVPHKFKTFKKIRPCDRNQRYQIATFSKNELQLINLAPEKHTVKQKYHPRLCLVLAGTFVIKILNKCALIQFAAEICLVVLKMTSVTIKSTLQKSF